MSAEYQPNLSFASQIPAEFLKLREYSANPDISWFFFISQPKFKKKNWLMGLVLLSDTIAMPQQMIRKYSNISPDDLASYLGTKTGIYAQDTPVAITEYWSNQILSE